ncbi:fibroblast growth factor 2 [Sus scrofa]
MSFGWRGVGLGRLLGNRRGRGLWSCGGLGFGLLPRPRISPARDCLPTPFGCRALAGRRAGREEGRGRGGWWAFGGGDVEDVTPRGSAGARPADSEPAVASRSRALQFGEAALPRVAAAEKPSPNPQLQGRRRAKRPNSTRLGARGRGRVPRGGRLGGRGRGRAPERVGGRGRGSAAAAAAAPRAAPGARGPRQSPGGAMAAGSITTLPALPEDGGSGAFPPGHFKDPKRLYCKNGGFFLRIHPDGRVDGVREKSDPHIKLQLQAEERGVVSIKGVCANRYLAMKEDGRLLASILCFIHTGLLSALHTLWPDPVVAYPPFAWKLFSEIWTVNSFTSFEKCVTDECFFFERLESNNYNTYRSRKYSSWYVALKRTGQYKLGPKTGPGQKAILFLPMSAKS